MADLHTIGGIPAVIAYLIEKGILHGDTLTVTGKTLYENVRDLPRLGFSSEPSAVAKGPGPGGQNLILNVENPLKKTGHLTVLKGNIAPDGAVAKLTGKEGLSFTGRALVYDNEEDMVRALEQGKIVKGEKQVVVIRYEGPKGGPGMPEMLLPTSSLKGTGLSNDVALITDGRFSGASHGFLIGHISPEAQDAGPLAFLKDGDMITIRVSHKPGEPGSIDAQVSDEEFNARRKSMQIRPLRATTGILGKYIRSVSSASTGCLTDQ